MLVNTSLWVTRTFRKTRLKDRELRPRSRTPTLEMSTLLDPTRVCKWLDSRLSRMKPKITNLAEADVVAVEVVVVAVVETRLTDNLKAAEALVAVKEESFS